MPLEDLEQILIAGDDYWTELPLELHAYKDKAKGNKPVQGPKHFESTSNRSVTFRWMFDKLRAVKLEPSRWGDFRSTFESVCSRLLPEATSEELGVNLQDVINCLAAV